MCKRLIEFLKAQPRWRLAAAAAGAVVALAMLWPRHHDSTGAATFAARRGTLPISVLEGGTMQALDSQELKCEVRVGFQGAKILKIVDEGYLVTEEDAKAGKVLVELDSSELQKGLIQQEIVYQASAAVLADAQQAYDIQLNQNISDMMAVEQKARFARMDFEKFLGTKAANEVIVEMGLDELFQMARTNRSATPALEMRTPSLELGTNAVDATLQADEVRSQATLTLNRSAMLASLIVPSGAWTAATNFVPPPTPAEPRKPSSINFGQYASIDVLGDGEAKQKIRKFQDDLQVTQKEMGQAEATLDGTKRLFAKQFVTRTDLQRDEIAFENMRLKVKTAETARDLFLKYEFLKTSEETLSKYAEAVREMERARKAAIARLAQAEARLRSAAAQYNVQVRQRADLEQQIERCTIRAQKPGLVIYGRAGDDAAFVGGEERIREGATVRERQTILTIPDMTHMGVRVKIHETYIKKIVIGQQARITVDAFPDLILDGEVTKVGVLPDSQNRWMNPDLKVYLTTVSIDGTSDWLKPGMSTKVEILVAELNDVVYVPLQSVVPENGQYVCYLARSGAPERRAVEIGQFNNEFIEIKLGLAENDIVLLNPPKSLVPLAGGDESKLGTDKNDSTQAVLTNAAAAVGSSNALERSGRLRPNREEN